MRIICIQAFSHVAERGLELNTVWLSRYAVLLYFIVPYVDLLDYVCECQSWGGKAYFKGSISNQFDFDFTSNQHPRDQSSSLVYINEAGVQVHILNFAKQPPC